MKTQERITERIFQLCDENQDKVNLVRTKSKKASIVKARLSICDELTKLGYSVMSIAKNLDMDTSTICKGLKRYRNEIELKEIASKIIKVRG